MKYAFLVAWREYAESAKAKGFWLSLFLTPVILFLSIRVPVLLEEKATPIRYFVLVDQSGSLAPAIESRLATTRQRQLFDALKDYARKYSVPTTALTAGDPGDASQESVETFVSKGGKEYFLAQLGPHLRTNAPAFKEPRPHFEQLPLPAGISPKLDLATIGEALKPYLRGEKQVSTPAGQVGLSAAILIPPDLASHIVRPDATPGQTPSSAARIQYWSVDASDPRLRENVEGAVNGEIRRQEYLARGMDATAIRQVERTYAPFTALNPKKEKGKEAVGSEDIIRQWAPSAFVYLLWLAIFVIVQMLLNNTIEEKSNRIIEVLLSSVTPGELMMGKLFGIAAIGLTMVGAWIASLFIILGAQSGGASQLAGQVLVVIKGSNLVPLFAIYFLLGYLMYAAFILAIGSVCNTIKEAQSYMGLLTMVMMIPLLTLMFIPKDPNGSLARLLSWIPLYTPFIMMNRANADPPLVDLIGTLILLLATTALALWMCGKVFRIGILRTGQPPKLLELLRWATRSDKK